jgi:hypothetical protein
MHGNLAIHAQKHKSFFSFLRGCCGEKHLCVARTHLIALARMLKGLQGYGVGARRLARPACAECREDILDSLPRFVAWY